MPVLRLVLVLVFFAGCVHRSVRASPEAFTEEPPAGKVGVTAMSEEDGRSWELRDRAGTCPLPCARMVDEDENLSFASNAGDVVYLNPMAFELPLHRRAMLIAEGPNAGERINGIVFTTLGSMGAAVAITLTAVGCSDTARRGGMCAAGLITGAVTVPLTVVSIWMIVDSGPKVHVLPVVDLPAKKGDPSVSLLLTPAGIAGRF